MPEPVELQTKTGQRGLPCLGSFSIYCSLCQAHKGGPLAGVLLCRSASQTLKGAPWVGSYSVVQCFRYLMARLSIVQLPMLAYWGREAMVMAAPPTHDSAVSPSSMAARLSSTGISHHSLLSHIPWICLSAVNSSPCPGIAPQFLNSSSQPLCLPGYLCPCLGYVWLWQGLSDSHSI